MKAIIMAGGYGSRLRPLTNLLPKPMVPIINKPIISFIVSLLKKHGIVDIAITLGYKPECIIDYFRDGSDQGVSITYFVEQTPLGTAGSVKNAADFIDDEVLIISGDAFTNLDIDQLIDFHHSHDGLLTMGCKEMDDVSAFGVICKDSRGKILSFKEKPRESAEHSVNTGIYVMSRELLEYIPCGVKFDFARDLFPMVMGDIFAMDIDGYWSDIGTLSSYYLTNNEVANHLEYYGIII